MAQEVTREKALGAIKDVMHPAINCSLKDLGIARDISIDGNKLQLTMALPFAGVPASMQQQMAEALVEKLAPLGLEIQVRGVLMTEEEKQNFLYLEHANWKEGENPQCG